MQAGPGQQGTLGRPRAAPRGWRCAQSGSCRRSAGRVPSVAVTRPGAQGFVLRCPDSVCCPGWLAAVPSDDQQPGGQAAWPHHDQQRLYAPVHISLQQISQPWPGPQTAGLPAWPQQSVWAAWQAAQPTSTPYAPPWPHAAVPVRAGGGPAGSWSQPDVASPGQQSAPPPAGWHHAALAGNQDSHMPWPQAAQSPPARANCKPASSFSQPGMRSAGQQPAQSPPAGLQAAGYSCAAHQPWSSGTALTPADRDPSRCSAQAAAASARQPVDPADPAVLAHPPEPSQWEHQRHRAAAAPQASAGDSGWNNHSPQHSCQSPGQPASFPVPYRAPQAPDSPCSSLEQGSAQDDSPWPSKRVVMRSGSQQQGSRRSGSTAQPRPAWHDLAPSPAHRGIGPALQPAQAEAIAAQQAKLRPGRQESEPQSRQTGMPQSPQHGTDGVGATWPGQPARHSSEEVSSAAVPISPARPHCYWWTPGVDDPPEPPSPPKLPGALA